MNILSRLHRSIQFYVKKKLLPELGAPDADFTLQPAPQGVHSRVFYLTVAGMDPLVLKTIDRRERLRDLLRCSRHLQQHAVLTPEIVAAHEDRALLMKRGFHALVERRLCGKTLKEYDDWTELIPAAGAFFSRLHAVRRKSWGKIEQGSGADFFDYISGRLAGKLAQWRRHDSARDLQDAVMPWAVPFRSTIASLSSFSLSHCDPNPGNIFAADDGRIFLLDIGHMRYLPRALDYYTLQLHLCEGDAGRVALLEEAYFRGIPAAEREQFAVGADFFKLYVLVNFAATLARSRATASVADPYYDAYARYLALAHTMIAELLHGRRKSGAAAAAPLGL